MKYLYWFLGLVVVGGVGYLGYQYGAGNIQFDATPKNNAVVPVNTDTSMTQNVVGNVILPTPLQWPSLNNSLSTGINGGVTNPTSWKTYTNKVLGFSIQYPSEYKLTDNLQKSASEEGGPNGTLKFTKSSDPFEPTLYLWVNPVGFGPFFADANFVFTTTKTGTTIGEWTKAESNEYDDPALYEAMGGNGFSENMGVGTGVNSYMISFSYKTGGVAHEAALRQIIASLKNL